MQWWFGYEPLLEIRATDSKAYTTTFVIRLLLITKKFSLSSGRMLHIKIRTSDVGNFQQRCPHHSFDNNLLLDRSTLLPKTEHVLFVWLCRKVAKFVLHSTMLMVCTGINVQCLACEISTRQHRKEILPWLQHHGLQGCHDTHLHICHGWWVGRPWDHQGQSW